MESLGMEDIDSIASGTSIIAHTTAPTTSSLGTDVRSPANSADTVRPLQSEDFCGREAEELSRIRANPDLGSARRFAQQLKCEALKAQVSRLLQSLGD
jgi:hypothetical protein